MKLVNKKHYLIGIVLVCLAFLSLQVMPTYAATTDTPSFVRIVHASPDIGSADVFVDGQHLLSNFQFGTVTPYVQLPPGPHSVKVGLIGTGPGAAVITQGISVQAGVAYTVAALGTKAIGFSLKVFSDNNLIAPGQAKVRVYHLSPGTGEVNVSTGSNQVISGLSYQEASNYLTMPAGAYSFNIDATQNNTTLPLSDNFKAGTVTSVFAIGLLSGAPKIRFITVQVNGIPGLPGTGSDPYATPEHNATPSQPVAPWLLGGLGVFVLLALVSKRRKALSK